ncbi:hypothetical protein LN42_00480 [Marinitoga sp. 1137]|uniref:hypothetical protein n=1 Tax=Marinitoga sp. 1137 TaxID=1545835 RepID=UPI000950627D|nr:hypothetical protein [Marinitoga sp. 1137]APT75041.1 hypothetical protein LN42_00480 [Marinitoga sp. 1137]
MEFTLPEIIATTEKLDLSYRTVFASGSDSGVVNSLIALFQLLDEDKILSYITKLITSNVNLDLSKWIDEEFSSRGFNLGKNKSERFLVTKFLLENFIKDPSLPIGLGHSWYPRNNLQNFLNDFFNTFYRELKFMLIDLRVKAELNESKNISEQIITNIVLGGTVQNVQAKNIDKSEFTQNE